MKYVGEHWLVVWFFCLFIIELFFYNHRLIREPMSRSHWYSNIINYAVTKFISVIVISPIIEYSSDHRMYTLLSNYGVIYSVVLGLIILDLTGYFFHVASHKLEFLWRFHEIHHLDEILDTSTSLRVHFIESFFHSLFNCIVIFIVGINKETIAVYSFISFLFATYHHSNFMAPISIERVLSFFVTTPRYHAPHHDRDIVNNQSNYAFIFPVWDRLFSTYNKNTFNKTWDFGLAYTKDVPPIKTLVRPLRRMIK